MRLGLGMVIPCIKRQKTMYTCIRKLILTHWRETLSLPSSLLLLNLKPGYPARPPEERCVQDAAALRAGGQQDRPGAREDGQVGQAPPLRAGQRPPDVRGLGQVGRGRQPLLPEDPGRAAGHPPLQAGPGAAAAGRQGGDRHLPAGHRAARAAERQALRRLRTAITCTGCTVALRIWAMGRQTNKSRVIKLLYVTILNEINYHVDDLYWSRKEHLYACMWLRECCTEFETNFTKPGSSICFGPSKVKRGS